MTLSSLRSSITDSLIFGICCAIPAANLYAQSAPGSDRVRVEVTEDTKTDRENIKGTHTDRLTVHKTLQLRLTGKPKSPETRVVRWTIYGKNLPANDLATVATDQFSLSLAADGTQAVTTKRATMTHTPDHILSHGKKREGGKVAAQGAKYLGYVVQVFDGEKLVGEKSDPPGLEKRR
jgi:hypothetical protein